MTAKASSAAQINLTRSGNLAKVYSVVSQIQAKEKVENKGQSIGGRKSSLHSPKSESKLSVVQSSKNQDSVIRSKINSQH